MNDDGGTLVPVLSLGELEDLEAILAQRRAAAAAVRRAQCPWPLRTQGQGPSDAPVDLMRAVSRVWALQASEAAIAERLCERSTG